MEAYFDNKGDVLNACIRIQRDDSAIYTIKTNFGLRGRKLTILRDENPATGRNACVGHIHWKEKLFEIHGQKKPVSEVRRTAGRFLKKSYHWRWTPERKEYEVKYHREGWKATLDNNMLIAARFLVPFRPYLFSKPEPPLLHLTKTALEEDEVFMILIFIYSEVKRQDKTLVIEWRGWMVMKPVSRYHDMVLHLMFISLCKGKTETLSILTVPVPPSVPA